MDEKTSRTKPDSPSGYRSLTIEGEVRTPGRLKIPLGFTLRELVEQAGGFKSGSRVKGFSFDEGANGFLPIEKMDIPLYPEAMMTQGVNPDFEIIRTIGRNDCPVEWTRLAIIRIVRKIKNESEEKRLLTFQAFRLIMDIGLGRAGENHFDQLKQLSQRLRSLKARASWPLWSSLNHFPKDWNGHLKEEKCGSAYCLLPKSAPCQFACPAGIDVPSYVALIGQGRPEEALNLIREDNPLPSVCGYVCPAPCEAQCYRGKIDTAVSIKSIKRFISDYVRLKGEKISGGLIFRQEKVAVVGSGPAGLTAAYYLTREGYPVTVFEALPVLGGMLRVGIPSYRLPREVLEFDIQAIARMGVSLRANHRLGRDFTLDTLREQGYQAFFLATGAHEDIRLHIPGEELSGVLSGVDFLRRVALGQSVSLGKHIAVIGGGNVAMDAARTARRLGSSVIILYRRTEAEMPAHADEIEQAEEEGIAIHYLTQPIEIRGDDKGVNGLVCISMKLEEPDASGRRRPIPIPGSETTWPVDGVIKTIGQVPEAFDFNALGDSLKVTPRGTVEVHPLALSTNIPGLFAGGDNVTGPATVVEAIKAGKQAARAITAYLQNLSGHESVTLPFPRAKISPLQTLPETRSNLIRPLMPKRGDRKNIKDFHLVELGLTEGMVKNEAVRCLRCDLCIGCGLCQEVCKEIGAEALAFKETQGDRLVFEDFARPDSRCIGCGSCALVCPTGAMQIKDRGHYREVIFTGTPLKKHSLLTCTRCGRYYFPPAQMSYLKKRLESLPSDHLDQGLCPQCARLFRAEAITGDLV